MLKSLTRKTAFVTHTLKMVAIILFSRYRFSKKVLLTDYLKLIQASVEFHKSDDTRSGVKEITILGCRISFISYGEIVDLFEEIFIRKSYDPGNSGPELIIDCGSHIGMSILYFKLSFPRVKILAFEPHAETFKLLKLNIERNKLTDVECLNVGLSNKTGRAMLFGQKDFSLNTSLQPDHREGSASVQEVSVELLSDFVRRRIDLIKIDTEGSEDEIIQDLLSSGRIKFVDRVIVEHHSEEKIQEFLENLFKAGFYLKRMRKNEKSKEALLFVVNRNASGINQK